MDQTLANQAPTCAVDIIVQNLSGELLLCRLADRWTERGAYLWGLPGREVEVGETLLEAAARSLHDELAVGVGTAEVVTVNSNFGFGNHYITVGVLVATDGVPEIQKVDDWTGLQWFRTEALPARLFPSASRTLAAYTRGVISVDAPS